MHVVSCPWCNSPLPDAISTQVCTTCGKTLHSVIPTTSTISSSSETPDPNLKVIPKTFHLGTRNHPRRVLSAFSSFSLLRIPWLRQRSNRQSQKRKSFAVRRAFSIPLTLDPLEDEKPFTGPLQDQVSEENDLSQIRPNGQLTWQKVVEPSPHRQSYIYSPRPAVPENKRVAPDHARAISSSSFTLRTFKRSALARMKHTSPKMIFWISTVILCLISVGLFGITRTFGQTSTDTDAHPSFQITPSTLSVGATMTLRGDNFSPHAFIGFRRDNAIPLADTSNARLTQADTTGHFTDTVIVGDDWGAGSHLITVEDSLSHKVASFPISIDGAGMSLRPPHLRLSADTLDFGSGDQATNSTKKLTLSNTGNGQIAWQASTGEDWLLIAPTVGNFTRDIPQEVTVAVDRSKMPNGLYNANLHFSSNGGDEYLSVSTQVVPLEPEHAAIMQISPAVLSFTATDGSSTAGSQQIMIGNSGGQAMNWDVSADVPWLTVSRSSLSIAPASFATTQVSVTSRNLLPGTYTGVLTFTAQNSVGGGVVFHSPQQVVVSITITPPCTLQVASPLLDFSSAYLQPAPSSKAIDITASAGCAAPINWDARSDAAWLNLNKVHGTTPSALSVGINVAGLTPNTYTGTITLSSSVGTQIVVVRFRLGPAGSAVISVGPSALSFSSVAEQSVPTAKTINLTNTGDGILNWQAAAITNLNLNWFQISPTSGTLAAHQTTTLTAKVTTTRLGNYNGTILLSGNNGAGQKATGSPLGIPVSYTVSPPPPVLATSTSSITMNVPGTTSSAIDLTNTGSSVLNWSARLQSGAPAFVSLSTASGSNLASKATVLFDVVVSAKGAASGLYQTSVTINATDAATNLPVTGSPITIPVTIKVAPPSMQVSATNVAFSSPVGGTVNPQSLTITNSGGGILSWTVTAPKKSWLSISTTAGSTTVDTGSPLTFSVQTNGLAPSSTPYTDQVVIRPSNGSPVTISISLMIIGSTPISTATSTATVTPTVTALPTPTPSPHANAVFERGYIYL